MKSFVSSGVCEGTEGSFGGLEGFWVEDSVEVGDEVGRKGESPEFLDKMG